MDLRIRIATLRLLRFARYDINLEKHPEVIARPQRLMRGDEAVSIQIEKGENHGEMV
jgi:hypothetical protein